jgi:hypothetical protein
MPHPVHPPRSSHPIPEADGPVADVVHACIVAGGLDGRETHYLRAGTGRPVLLLAGDPSVSGALVGALPRHFRAIAPRISPPSPDAPEFIPWIRGFLDALGIPRASIVVGPCFAAQILAFSLLEPERVERLVFLIGACGDWSADVDEGLVDRLGTSGQPLLATAFDPSDAPAASRTVTAIANFLATPNPES